MTIITTMACGDSGTWADFTWENGFIVSLSLSAQGATRYATIPIPAPGAQVLVSTLWGKIKVPQEISYCDAYGQSVRDCSWLETANIINAMIKAGVISCPGTAIGRDWYSLQRLASVGAVVPAGTGAIDIKAASYGAVYETTPSQVLVGPFSIIPETTTVTPAPVPALTPVILPETTTAAPSFGLDQNTIMKLIVGAIVIAIFIIVVIMPKTKGAAT